MGVGLYISRKCEGRSQLGKHYIEPVQNGEGACDTGISADGLKGRLTVIKWNLVIGHV